MAQPNPRDNEHLELKKIEANIWLMTFKFKTYTMDIVNAINLALDELDNETGELALITTSNHPSIYSAGLDFTVFSISVPYTMNFLMQFQRLLARFLKLSYPTIAAINGHCIAGGIMLAMAHDFRIQRDDMGQICLSEINLGMPIPHGMLFLIRDKIPYPALRQLALFGHKFTPKESLEGQLVDKLCKKEDLLKECIAMVSPWIEKSSARGSFAQIKTALNVRGVEAALKEFLPPLDLVPNPNKQKL